MTLRYQDFLSKIVEESLKAAREDYAQSPGTKHLLEGSVAGLLACKDKSPPELAFLLERARNTHRTAFHKTVLTRYWRITCFLHEVEWVCNVVSAALVNMGVDPIVNPTMRGALMARRITVEAAEQQTN